MTSSTTAIPSSRDKLLFTPGPLTTSLSVKQAALHDMGSWDVEFNTVVAEMRQRLLRLAGVSREGGYEVIPMQGSGTYGVEAVLASVIPPTGRVLIHSNGAYGERMIQMTKHLRMDSVAYRTDEDAIPDAAEVERLLKADPGITHVALVHCETTTGILNPLEEIGKVVKAQGRVFIVDAMSSFGAVPIDFESTGIDYLISSANKCIEGIPGFSFVFARRAALLATEGFARSLSLDILGQLRGFEKNGQFRYTPPTHSILAFMQALNELEMEGGVAGRGARYKRNHAALLEGMAEIGFRRFLPDHLQSYIITSFYFPEDARFTFLEFYKRMSERGMLIYPGKLTKADTFRLGSIGRLFENDMRQLVSAVADSLRVMGIEMTKNS